MRDELTRSDAARWFFAGREQPSFAHLLPHFSIDPTRVSSVVSNRSHPIDELFLVLIFSANVNLNSEMGFFKGLVVGVLVVFSLPFLYGVADQAAKKSQARAATRARAMTDDQILSYSGSDYNMQQAVAIEKLRRNLP